MTAVRSRKSKSAKNAANAALTIILPVALGVLIVALWQGGVLQKLFGTDDYVLPEPTRIFSIFQDNSSAVWANIKITTSVAMLGLLFGSLLGYAAAVLGALKPGIGAGALAVVGAFASVPLVALAPVMNNLTRDVSRVAETRSFVAKILVVMLIAAADMGLNAYRGLTELPPYAVDLMKTYAASSKTVFLKLRLPNSVPYIFTALKVSVPASIMTAIVSEYFAEFNGGVGRQIRENILLAQYSTAWVYIMAACGIGVGTYVILMIVRSIIARKFHM